MPSVSRVYAPHEYAVWLSPEDRARYEGFEHEVPVSRDELLDVVRRVSGMAQRNSPLRLRFAEGELTISAQTQDVGEEYSLAR